MFRFVHAADLHLDSAFGALAPQQAAARRRESREMPFRLANYVNTHGIDLVLLAGDLLDGHGAFRETGEQLAQALGQMEAQVCIAPGNHDFLGGGSVWETVDWPENVHIFREPRMTALELPELCAVVHGAAFTAPEQAESLLAGFAAPADGRVHLGVLHGEIDPAENRYDPLGKAEIAASGLAYLALGHIHKRTEPLRFGNTVCAWPGCPEGRGFDELGEKGVLWLEVEKGRTEAEFVPLCRRRYQILSVDLTGQADPAAAVLAALPTQTGEDIYRLLLTGERGLEGLDLGELERELSPRFWGLTLRDHTRAARALWERRGEDTLTGLFLREMEGRCQAEPENEAVQLAVRFGLAALEHGEDVAL